MIDFFDSSLQKTETMLKIDHIEMPRDTQMITFLSNEALLDCEAIKSEVQKSLKEKMFVPSFVGSYLMDSFQVSTKVEVKIMNIQWLMRGNKSFLDLVPILRSCPIEKLFLSDFMRSLTHEYWVNYQR